MLIKLPYKFKYGFIYMGTEVSVGASTVKDYTQLPNTSRFPTENNFSRTSQIMLTEMVNESIQNICKLTEMKTREELGLPT